MKYVRCQNVLRVWSSLAAAAVVLLIAAISTATTEADKRPPQDYGPARKASADEVLLWGPRVVFFPLWLTSEFAVRRPLGALVKVAEREQWPREIVDFFTFGEERQITIFPSAFFDFGLLPSVGFNAKWKNFLSEPNTIGLHFGTWGTDWVQARLIDRYSISKTEDVSIDGRFVRRKDNPFFGLGPNSSQSARSRYASQLGDLGAGYESRPWKSSVITARVGMRALSLEDVGTCCGDPSVQERISRERVPAPPGLGDGYFGGYQRISVALDSRKPRPDAGTGVRVEAHEEGVFAPATSASGRRAWTRYGAQAGAFFDITGTQRVVSLNASVEMADPLVGAIPFPEQATLGGDRPLRGYIRERLIDRSAFAIGLHYTWPVWVFLDGVIEIDAGNVFGPQLAGFDPKLFRLSSGIGVRSNGSRESGFELLVAGATDPFDQRFAVSSVRFLVGSHHGF